jgi:alkanesulfonate monooxygenase SsuD/methylene tetrahydromethanopterin reductase-like flavin-dependent oxidoreductase (luciferase family)
VIGRIPPPAAERRKLLCETVLALRAIWNGDAFAGQSFTVSDSANVVAPVSAPPVMIGASTMMTALIAVEHADGVNLQSWDQRLVAGDAVFRQVREVRRAVGGRRFDVSVNRDMDLDHPLGGTVQTLIDHGVDRRTLAIRAPFDVDAVASIGVRLVEAGL